MNHKAIRIDNLMYEGCEPHWKCIHCGKCVPFHCWSKIEFESQECDEVWLPIKSLNSRFSASSYGRIRNNNTQHVLSPTKGSDKRYRVCVNKGGRPTAVLVSSLVAECFLTPVEGSTFIKFKDGDYSNLRPENLYYSKGISGKIGKIRCIETQEVFQSGHDAGKKLGIDKSLVYSALRTGGKVKGKFSFEKVEEVADDVEG